MPLPPRRSALRRAVLPAAIWLLAAGAPLAARPQQTAPEAPLDVAAREAQVEAVWAAALAVPDTDPLHKLQVWGVVFQSEVMLDRVRAAAGGVRELEAAGPGDVVERVLARWRRLRPTDGGPDLFLALQIQEPEEQRRAVVALLDRHPDDALVVWQATTKLRQGGDSRRAAEVLEAFLIRNPQRPVAYRLLSSHYQGTENATELVRVLRGWASLAPADPELVTRWLAAGLPRREPEATAVMLDRFFGSRPTGTGAPSACLRTAQAVPAYATEARACLERLAADPDSGSAVAEQATTALAKLAAAADDRPGLESALGRLGPDARFRATIEAVRRLETPDGCEERIDRLRQAMNEMPWDTDRPAAIAAALAPCATRPAAEAIYLELVRRVPSSRLDRVIGGWATKVNGVWRGDLPVDTVAPILESRFEREGESERLFWALDVVYQLGGEADKRFDLLRRWQQRMPAAFRGEQAIALAGGLLLRGEPDEATRVLERQLEHRFEHPVAEQRWGLYLGAGDEAGAERFARELIATGERSQVSVGQLLAARSAFLRQAYGEAEGQYWAHLEGRFPRREAAEELLALVALQGEDERLPGLARRICAETPIGVGRGDATRCASELLAAAGSGEAAGGLLVEQAAELPDEVPALRELATTAQSAGQPEVAERALRRILELDPAGTAGWVSLAVFLEKQARLDDLERLLSSARETLAPPPPNFLRAVARACLAAGQPRRAIDLLQEARDGLASGSDPAWIDAELRDAYRALGRQQP